MSLKRGLDRSHEIGCYGTRQQRVCTLQLVGRIRGAEERKLLARRAGESRRRRCSRFGRRRAGDGRGRIRPFGLPHRIEVDLESAPQGDDADEHCDEDEAPSDRRCRRHTAGRRAAGTFGSPIREHRERDGREAGEGNGRGSREGGDRSQFDDDRVRSEAVIESGHFDEPKRERVEAAPHDTGRFAEVGNLRAR